MIKYGIISLCLLFSYQQTQASGLECSGVFSSPAKAHFSAEDYVIQNVLANLKTFNSRLAKELTDNSNKLPAAVMMSFLNREFNSVDEIYRNTIINDLSIILNDYDKSESEIYDIITKLQENLKPSAFKKMFTRSSKMARTKDSLVDEIIKCRLGLLTCSTAIGEKMPDFERTYSLVKSLFTSYKNIAEYLNSNRQQIIDILNQSAESGNNAIMLFEGKVNSLQSQLSVIKIKKDQLEQQYVNAVNIISLKYPEITNQIKLLISLGAPEKIESGFQEAIENLKRQNELNRVALANNLKLEQEQAAATERLKQEELAKIEKVKSSIAYINSNQKLNLMQTNLEPNNYKIDLDIIEDQIIKANHLTTRDLIYFLSLAQTVKRSTVNNNNYYALNFYKYFNGKESPQVSEGYMLAYKNIFSLYKGKFGDIDTLWLFYFERILPILLHKWKPAYISQELEIRNELQRLITETEINNVPNRESAILAVRSTSKMLMEEKIKVLLEVVNGVKYGIDSK